MPCTRPLCGLALLAVLALASCGGGSSSTSTPAPAASTAQKAATPQSVKFPAANAKDFATLTPAHWRGGWWPFNCWAGTTAGTQKTADKNVPALLHAAAAAPVRFVSGEPLLESVDYRRWLGTRGIDWLILGGESNQPGAPARTCDIAWIRSGVMQAADFGVPVHVKQLGDSRVETSGLGVCTASPTLNKIRAPKGGDINEWPVDIRVRGYPVVRP